MLNIHDYQTQVVLSIPIFANYMPLTLVNMNVNLILTDFSLTLFTFFQIQKTFNSY